MIKQWGGKDKINHAKNGSITLMKLRKREENNLLPCHLLKFTENKLITLLNWGWISNWGKLDLFLPVIHTDYHVDVKLLLLLKMTWHFFPHEGEIMENFLDTSWFWSWMCCPNALYIILVLGRWDFEFGKEMKWERKIYFLFNFFTILTPQQMYYKQLTFHCLCT